MLMNALLIRGSFIVLFIKNNTEKHGMEQIRILILIVFVTGMPGTIWARIELRFEGTSKLPLRPRYFGAFNRIPVRL